ncbi:isocitrate/isopropylmalate dehydrogenase family protein [Kozakia baliensis]|uniref:Isocitrate dehydrogenase n=1 Tax=Kozakia baliensis TaxID=153496 RepID=A0A1D8UU12_9PROT|nr:isocitrate/isopropylmalate family dehydrogenase [Kozakia baliensis]AOX16957.1 isocitrate dehydrogenase [Kozakia baliensis]AOX19800.1 isocitrate dehydrogenase [Kozakia baliensis]GBR25471.1 isocitrate dehydrogenase [Kozakia baliensis NRIC 0488]GEL63995.1 isocitrate dehydrogenase [Kozakia baliensis]
MVVDQNIPATLVEGDGIGPEITASVVELLDVLGAPFAWDRQSGGLEAVEKYGAPLPQQTLDSIRKTGLALKGPLTTPVGAGFRSVNVTLRQEFGLYANLRPTKTVVSGQHFDHIDLVVVRENIEGLYAAKEYYLPDGDDPQGLAFGGGFNSRRECARIVRFAFEYALANGRKKVTLVHKANILKLFSGIFLEEGRRVAKEYEGRVAVEERIVDACAMQLVTDPWQYDVIVTTNLFGDILSDLTAGLVGGLGMAPGANIGTDVAIFEAVHGSAPDIAGKGVANPLALLMAASLMLAHVGRFDLRKRLDDAIEKVVHQDGVRTRDLGGTAGTKELTEALAAALR